MRLSLFGGLRPLKLTRALRDITAGATLASMNIPQVLGYTRIAGTPAITGLYTVLLPVVAFAIFGSSRHLVVAADSATAAIFSSSLSGMATPGSEAYLAMAGMVALLTAGLLLAARVFKLGFLADFLSRTVLVGFLAGVGIQVAVAMLGDMLGVSVTSRHTMLQAWQIVEALPRSNIPTLCLSFAVATAILTGNRVVPHLPLSLVAVLATIWASATFDFATRGIAVIGPVPGGLPSFGLPDVSWSQSLSLLPVAAVAVWTVVNPRVFPPPREITSWASRSVLGEKPWSDRKEAPGGADARQAVVHRPDGAALRRRRQFSRRSSARICMKRNSPGRPTTLSYAATSTSRNRSRSVGANRSVHAVVPTSHHCRNLVRDP